MNPLSPGIPSLLMKNNPIMHSSKTNSVFFSSKTSLSHSPTILDKFASSLNNCHDLPSLKKIHACIFNHGLQDNIFLGSKLLNSYAKFSLLPESRWVFRKFINNNLSFWNSTLVGYFRAGHFDEVLRVYSELRRRTISIHSSAITFSLKSCVELGCLELGSAIHLDAIRCRLDTDPFVGSSLIGLYSKYGHIEDAAKVFDKILDKDLVAYTSMITGYARIGDGRANEAFEVARCMQKEEFDPNRVTLVSLLQAAALLRALEHGQSVHGFSVRRGIGRGDEVFETSLMDMYVKCGALNKAAAVFSNMSSTKVGFWNTLIGGHLQLGQPLDALNLFFIMVQENLDPDLITLASGVLSCADMELLREGKSIHGYILRNGIQLDVVATTALIDMYLRCNRTSTARKIFDTIKKKDVISYSVLISGYLQNGFACEVTEAFCEMVGTGVGPNTSSILSLLSAVSDLRDVRQGKCIHGYIFRHGFESITDLANQVLQMYASCGFIERATQVFNRIKSKDLVSWTSMMMGCVGNNHASEAITLFRLMQRERQQYPDSITFICLLQSFAQLGCLSFTKEVHCHLLRLNTMAETPVINSLITVYSKCGRLHMARDLFEHMAGRCLASWNTMIAAYGMHGNSVHALKLFDQMKKENIVPDEVTFTSVLSACSHSGLVKEGLSVFRSMKEDYSLLPCEEHYGCIVDLLSRAGQLEEAYDLLKYVPSKYSASALNALLAACRVHGNTEMGKAIGRKLLDLEPKNPSAFGLVSNLYAEGQQWDEVAQIRYTAKAKGLRRAAGHSLIELDTQLLEI